MELEIKKGKPNGGAAKQSPLQRPCTKMQEAVVMDGGKRGQVVKVCADQSCHVHHPNTPSAQIERQRAEERRRIEKEKLTITTRHRILAAVLQRISAPLKKGDLLTIAEHLIRGLPHNQIAVLAKRHKIDPKLGSASAHELVAKQVARWDEAELLKLLLEISLLDSAYQRASSSGDVLIDAAKRYRVDTDKIGKAVAEAFALKQKERKASASKKAKEQPTTSDTPASA